MSTARRKYGHSVYWSYWNLRMKISGTAYTVVSFLLVLSLYPTVVSHKWYFYLAWIFGLLVNYLLLHETLMNHYLRNEWQTSIEKGESYVR